MTDFRGQRRGANAAELGFSVTGLDQMLALSKALKGWDAELRKEMHKGFRDAAKPMLPVIREGIRQDYPQRGGLAAKMAKAPAKTQYLTGRDPGVRITVKGLQIKLGEVYGLIRHPVFADPDKTRREWTWVSQKIPANQIQDRVRRNVRLVLPGLEDVLERTAQKVLSRGMK